MKVTIVQASNNPCRHTFEVSIISGDFLQEVLNVKEDKVLVLDMANPYEKGGFGKFNTKIALGQEEYLVRYSNLKQGLDRIKYPLKCDRFIPLISNVSFVSQSEDRIKDCDVAVCAATMHSELNTVNGRDTLTDSEVCSMRKRIRTLLSIAKDYEVAVFSALGCGAFRCPPEDVSKIFKEEIDSCNKNASLKKTHIKFVIKSENYVKDNYNVFKNTLL